MSLRNLTACYILLLFSNVSIASESNTINFKSADNLLITADTYFTHPSSTSPVIVLFHQAGWSRGEYNEIAPQLNALGFNCIAIDLRSGDNIRGKENETALRARTAGLGTNYADALPDVIAALQYANKQYRNSKIIAWGSSYSAALVLKAAGDHPELVDGVLAFSPGEYFYHLGKSKSWVRDSAQKIKIPTFITSSKKEADDWALIFKAMPADYRQSFVPETDGNHGSRALWTKYDDNTAYWGAVTEFLNKFLSVKSIS